jgi:hypothetical protein
MEKPIEDQSRPDVGKPEPEDRTAPIPPVINPAVCATMMKHIGKRFVVQQPVLAVQMEEYFNINNREFEAGDYIVEMKDETGATLFVGLGEMAFNNLYRPARKPREKKAE